MKIFSQKFLLIFLLTIFVATPLLARDSITKNYNFNTTIERGISPQPKAVNRIITEKPEYQKAPSASYDIEKHKSPSIHKDRTLGVIEKLRSRKFLDIHTNEINPVYVPSKNQIETERFRLKRRNFADFTKREYVKLADRLFLHHNYTDATHFRRKGLKADGLRDILPEDPKKWEIKDDIELDDLLKARIALLESLSVNAVYVAPNAAAKSLVFYDCWVSQAKNKWVDERTNCKMAFKEVNDYLHGIYEETKFKGLAEVISGYAHTDIDENYTPFKNYEAEEEYEGNYAQELVRVIENRVKDDEAKRLLDEKVASENKKEAGNFIYARGGGGSDLMYLAYFDKKSFELDANARAELDKVAEQIKKSNPPSVIINGHTDRSIGDNEAMVLSKKRADIARDYLIGKGVNKNLFRTFGFGKNDNIVPNEEGKEAAANRRVEIVFKGKAEKSN
ncbi:MAG: OmpA family protein [Rickettsiales bacterium]|nr:OmpA family protein [Rickettsiales bacterium]